MTKHIIAAAIVLALCAIVKAQTAATGIGVTPRSSAQRQSPEQKQSSPPPAPKARAKIVVRESDTPLPLGDQTCHFVARIQRIDASAEETTEWWELRDAKGGLIYHQSYGVTVGDHGFEWTTEVSARVFTTKLGSGVLVEGMDLPSAPGTGGWVQVFGFKWGPTKATTLTAFGPPMSTDGELLDIATDPRRQAQPVPGRTVFVMNDILRFRVWTGNLSIIYPVLINWITGKLEPSWHCLRRTSHGQVDRCNYPVQVEPIARSERTFVRLFPEPTEDFTPAHVVVEPASKLEFMEAEVPMAWSDDGKNISFGVSPDGDTWIKVRIDGREGWIHTQEDFDAVGLPQSG